MDTDRDLLDQFVRRRSAEAFAQLVDRHLPWVHAAARRKLGDAHLAEDVAQATFMLLAKKAPTLGEKVLVSGWLFRAAMFACKEAIRQKNRRQRHETRAAMLNPAPSSAPGAEEESWKELLPCLDEAVSALPTAYRDALILRYYQNLPLAEVGDRLQTTGEAARKRVDRGLEQLRHYFAKRQLAVPATLGAALATHLAMPASPALAGTTVSASLATGGGAVTGSAGVLALAAGKGMMLAKLQAAAIVALTAGAAITLSITGYFAATAPAPAPSSAPVIASAPAPLAAPVPAASANAVDLYQQAIALMPASKQDVELLTKWVLDPRGKAYDDFFLRYQPCLNLLHQAASLPHADWGQVTTQHQLQDQMSLGSSIRVLSVLLDLHARWLMAQGRHQEAVDSLAANFALTRHLSAQAILINRMVAMGMSNLNVTHLALYLPLLPKDKVRDLQIRLSGWSFMTTLRDTFQAERLLMTSSLQNQGLADSLPPLNDLFDDLDRIAALPLKEMPSALQELSARSSKYGPLAQPLCAPLLRTVENEQGCQVRLAMLQASLAIWLDGREVLAQFPDPLGNGPFEYRATERGFILKSQLQGGKESLTVGH